MARQFGSSFTLIDTGTQGVLGSGREEYRMPTVYARTLRRAAELLGGGRRARRSTGRDEEGARSVAADQRDFDLFLGEAFLHARVITRSRSSSNPCRAAATDAFVLALSPSIDTPCTAAQGVRNVIKTSPGRPHGWRQISSQRATQQRARLPAVLRPRLPHRKLRLPRREKSPLARVRVRASALAAEISAEALSVGPSRAGGAGTPPPRFQPTPGLR
jgi:hypothetical protein